MRRRWAIVLWAAVLALAFTAFSVWQSTRLGRLASVPNYDDVVYFLSATRLIEGFGDGGFSGVFEQLRLHGLHAPFSTIAATAAFAILGERDFAPYAFNAVIVLLYLGGLAWLLREWRAPERVLALVFYLSLPFATMAVVEFRPDLCWATLIGLCAAFGMSAPGYFSRWRAPLVHALLCGLALLAKPSTFAMTFIVFGYSVLVRYAIELAVSRRFFIAALAKRAAAQAGLVAAVTAPYTIPYGADTWVYFWRNSFGANKQIWTYAGNAHEHFFYYLTGYGGINNLGWPGLMAVAVLVLAPVAAFASRRPERVVRAAGILGLVALAWGINTWAGMKSPFLGGAFYASVIFGSAMELPGVLGLFARTGRSRAVATLCLAIAGCALYRFPAYSGELHSVDGRNYASATSRALALVGSLELRERPVLMFTQSGPVVPDDVVIFLLRHGLRPRVVSQQFARDGEDFASKLGRADLVFLQPAGMRGAFFNLPSEKLQPEFRRLVEADRRYRLLGEIEGVDGASVSVYERVRRKPRDSEAE